MEHQWQLSGLQWRRAGDRLCDQRIAVAREFHRLHQVRHGRVGAGIVHDDAGVLCPHRERQPVRCLHQLDVARAAVIGEQLCVGDRVRVRDQDHARLRGKLAQQVRVDFAVLDGSRRGRRVPEHDLSEGAVGRRDDARSDWLERPRAAHRHELGHVEAVVVPEVALGNGWRQRYGIV